MKEDITNVISLHCIHDEHNLSLDESRKIEKFVSRDSDVSPVKTISLHVIFFIVIFFVDPISVWFLSFCGAAAHSDSGWCCNC